MNVVLIVIDSVRKDHVGAFGGTQAKTPNIDALAKESLIFTRSYPESMPTVCARRAIHTGVRTFPFRNWNPVPSDLVKLWGWQPIPEHQTTLAEVLQQQQYETLYVTDVPHGMKPFYDFHRGFNVFQFVRGQERDFYKPEWTYLKKEYNNTLIDGPNRAHMGDIMRQYLANIRGRRNTEDQWFAPQVYSHAIDYIDGIGKGSQPFFLMIDGYDPHEPWDPPEKYISMYSDGYSGPEPATSPNSTSDFMTEKEIERMKALYSAELTMVDTWLGRFMDKFYEMGLQDNTMIVLLSDHGFLLGEHGYAGKIPSELFPELTETIHLIRHPDGKGAGKSSDHYASTHDVAPTILGALGIEAPQEMNGQDLSVILDGGNPGTRDHFDASYNNHVWARDDKYAMMSFTTGDSPRLYDIQTDPGMTNDIVSKHPDIPKRMYRDYIVKDAGGPLPTY